jgi:putative glutamine amidotransferase
VTRPIIGVTTQTLQAIDDIPEALPSSWVMSQRYLEIVVHAGGVPVLVPLFDRHLDVLRDIYDRLDGLLIPGGVDMDPETFGETRLATLGRIDPPRDRVEVQLAQWAGEDGKPVLGLCRGLQIINVALGGTLYQDLGEQRPDAIRHDYYPTDGFARGYIAHEVEVEAASRLAALIGAGSLGVNSMHHQAIREVGSGLRVSAVAPDGLAEAAESADHPFMVGVQWHPESMNAGAAPMAPLFNALIEAARHKP